MHETVKSLAVWLSAVTEGVAALIITIAVVEAVVRTGLLLFRDVLPSRTALSHEAKEDVRLRLGRWLALSLEFLLAADILRTAVAPSWAEIGQLAAIATIRTALNFFLQLEIDKAEARRAGAAAGRPGQEQP